MRLLRMQRESRTIPPSPTKAKGIRMDAPFHFIALFSDSKTIAKLTP